MCVRESVCVRDRVCESVCVSMCMSVSVCADRALSKSMTVSMHWHDVSGCTDRSACVKSRAPGMCMVSAPMKGTFSPGYHRYGGLTPSLCPYCQ